MSRDQFQFVYEGSDVRAGSMDVYDLAPALLSVGDLVREANRFLNGDRSTVSVQVQSDFQRGSFEVLLAVDQSVIEQAKQVLFGGAIEDAKALVHLLFGHAGTITSATGAVIGVLKVYKMLKGARPKDTTIKIENNSTTVINNISIESRTAALYMNDVIRSTADRVMRPVAKDGIDVLEVRKDKEVLDRIEKQDLPPRVLESSREVSSAEVLQDTREAVVKVVKANFEKGKWTFSDGTAKFNADIKDPLFQRQLDNREIGFYKGDVLRVKLRIEQTVKSGGKIQSQYSIEEVLDRTPIPEQQRLLSKAKE